MNVRRQGTPGRLTRLDAPDVLNARTRTGRRSPWGCRPCSAQVLRARRLSSVAMTSYGVALIPDAIYAIQPDASGTLRWLAVMSVVLGCIAVGCFIAMLFVVVRWSPSRR